MMTNKKEVIKGRLVLANDNIWSVESGYGTFYFVKSLKKPDFMSNGAYVEATVQHGAVIDYHFADEKLD